MLAVGLNQNTSGEQGTGEKGPEASRMQASDPVLLDVLPSPGKLYVWLKLVPEISEQRASLKPRKQRNLNPGFKLNKLS